VTCQRRSADLIWEEIVSNCFSNRANKELASASCAS